MANYWNKALNRRLSRRRAMAATGAFGAAAAFLAACGGGDSSGGGGSGAAPSGSNSLVTEIKDESKNAIKGGVMLGYHPLTLVTYDPYFPGGHIRIVRRTYNQLWRIKDGVAEATDGSVEGDLVEKWEVNGDKTQITAKLNPKAMFPPVPPVNGRALDAQDVLSSWDFYLTRGNRRSELSHAINPSAPIESITSPDDKTIIIKLAQPNATIFTSLANLALGTFYILPKEATDGRMDVKTQAIGTGPFYVTTELNSIEYKWAKNPNFTRFGDLPYVDEIHEPILTETSAALAQFRAGAIYWGGPQAEDIVPLKKEKKELDVWMMAPNGAMQLRWFFGHNADSPFKDERVRQAFRMTWDIDAYNDALNNVASFESDGLPVESFFDTFISAGSWKGWWLDPKSKDFGENAKYYQYNIEEATKLLQAAGHQTPLAYDMTYAAPGPSSYPPFYFPRAEVIIGFSRDSKLFDPQIKLVNYATEWNAYRQAKGDFSGAAWSPDVAPPDPTGALFNVMHPNGSYFQGGDDYLRDLAEKALGEFDDKKRQSLIWDAQRHEAKSNFSPGPGQTHLVQITWPIIRNWLTFQGGTNNEDSHRFLDPSRAPGV
jgi:peptide/nickel transport system substrate-binding protein